MQDGIDVKVSTLFTENKSGESICKIDLTGDLTFSNYQNLASVMTDLLDADIKKIIIDLRNLKWIDSAGIGILISFARKSSVKNFEYVITGWNDPVESIMTLLNFKRIVKIFNTLEEGVAYFKQRNASLVCN